MWPYVVGAVVGLALVQHQLPRTRFRKLSVLGPRTGNHYRVEDFEGTTIIVVRKGSTSVTLQQNQSTPGYRLVTVKKGADPLLLDQIRADFSFDGEILPMTKRRE